MNKERLLADLVNYVTRTLAGNWTIGYNKSVKAFGSTTNSSAQGVVRLLLRDDTAFDIPLVDIGAGGASEPDGLTSPLGVITFDEATNKAVITLEFVVRVGGAIVTTAKYPSPLAEIVLPEKDAVYNRIDNIYVLNDGTLDYAVGNAVISPEAPIVPPNKTKIAEIFRSATGTTVITPSVVNGYYEKVGGPINGEVTITGGKNLHLKADPARPTDSGDIIFEDEDAVEIGRVFIFKGYIRPMFRINGIVPEVGMALLSDLNSYVAINAFENIPFTSATGVVNIDMNVVSAGSARFAKYPKRVLQAYTVAGAIETDLTGWSASYNTGTKILTIDGIFGTGYIRLS